MLKLITLKWNHLAIKIKNKKMEPFICRTVCHDYVVGCLPLLRIGTTKFNLETIVL